MPQLKKAAVSIFSITLILSLLFPAASFALEGVGGGPGGPAGTGGLSGKDAMGGYGPGASGTGGYGGDSPGESGTSGPGGGANSGGGFGPSGGSQSEGPSSGGGTGTGDNPSNPNAPGYFGGYGPTEAPADPGSGPSGGRTAGPGTTGAGVSPSDTTAPADPGSGPAGGRTAGPGTTGKGVGPTYSNEDSRPTSKNLSVPALSHLMNNVVVVPSMLAPVGKLSLTPLGVPIDVTHMFDLAKSVAPKSVQTTSFTPTANVHVDIPDNIVDAYNQFAQTAKAAQISGIGDNDPNTTYSFDPSKGGWYGNVDGKQATVDTFSPTEYGLLSQMEDLGKTDNISVTIDTYNSTISVTDTATGKTATKSTAEVADLAENNKSITGQEYGKSYAGPKGGPKGLNLAAQYAAVVYANQQVTPLKSTNVEEDAKILAAIAEVEGPKNTHTYTMEVAANRSLATGKSVKADATTKNAYQPITELAQKNCHCSTPTQAQMQKALDSIISKAQKSPYFATNVEIAKSIINGSHVRSAMTSKQLGFVNFANVDVTISLGKQGRASKSTVAANVAMRDDPESKTINPGKHNQQTYGIISGSKAPSFAPTTTSFDPSTLGQTPTNSPTYGGNTGTPSSGNEGETGSGDTGGGGKSGGTGGAGGGRDTSAPSGNQDGRTGMIDSLADALESLFGGGGGENTNNETFGGDIPCPPYPIPCQDPNNRNASPVSALEGNEMVGSALLGESNSDGQGMLKTLTNWVFGWFKKAEQDNSTAETIRTSATYVPVLITIDHQKQQIEIDRPDIIETLKNPSEHYTDEQLAILRKLLDETPFVFGSEGEVIHSNGLYSPPVYNGKKIADGVPRYIYSFEIIDQEGNLVTMDEMSEGTSTDGLFTIANQILGSASPFYIEDVDNVSYYRIDPDKNTPADEYYQYEITLKDGSNRRVTVPEFFSMSFIDNRLGQIGYTGDAMELVSRAVKKESSSGPGLLSGWLTSLTDLFKEREDGGTTGTFAELTTEFIGLEGGDLERVFIYPISDIACPNDIPEYEAGFMYVAVLKDRQNPGYEVAISDGRCGIGTIEQIVAETTNHLSKEYGVKDLNYESVFNKTFVIFEPVSFNASVTRVLASDETPVADTTVTNVGGNELGNETPPSPPTVIPNRTNAVTLEIKAIGADGKVLSDWIRTTGVTISSDVQLHFRWSANEYEQCLPFLQDGGSYALAKGGASMTTGNTETDGFNVPEKSAVYRVECGGQRNGEYGVDERAIEVVVQ